MFFASTSLLFSQSKISQIILSNKDTLEKSKLPDIRKYVKINIYGDSISLDTTLSIKKYYKFNYLGKIILSF